MPQTVVEPTLNQHSNIAEATDSDVVGFPYWRAFHLFEDKQVVIPVSQQSKPGKVGVNKGDEAAEKAFMGTLQFKLFYDTLPAKIEPQTSLDCIYVAILKQFVDYSCVYSLFGGMRGTSLISPRIRKLYHLNWV